MHCNQRLLTLCWHVLVKLQRLSVTRALQRFFFHFKNYVLVDANQMYPWQWRRAELLEPLFQCPFSEYPSCSFIFYTWLVDKHKLRRKTYKIVEARFRSSRSRAMFWSCKLTNMNSVQPEQHETEQTINNNIYYRMNYNNLTANLLRLSLPFYYWQSSLAAWFCWRFALNTICLSCIPTSLETRQDRSLDYVLARRMTRISAAKIMCIHN